MIFHRSLRFVHVFLALGTIVLSAAPGDEPSVLSADFIARVRHEIDSQPILRRPMTLAELKTARGFRMKYREKPAHLNHVDEAGWERFALSLADTEAARRLVRVLPAAAAAARESGDPVLLAFVREQLSELATWTPFERPGWSGGSVETSGAWLGTGWMIRAIVDTLAELPPDALRPELHDTLRARFSEEIVRIRDDWGTRRTWFARIEAVSSNQWILPLEALALASLHAGLDRHRDDYEFAVAGLLRSMDAQGPAGECVEGMQYGVISFDSLLSAAVAARAHGDERLFRHPWLQSFPIWYLHHRQPGGFMINAFDSNSPEWDWSLIARMATELQHPAAVWALAHRTAGPEAFPSLSLLRATRQHGASAEPVPPFAAYAVASRVNWLESLAAYESGSRNRVSGFWMRGGHASDAHDHQDRGHVNFIVRGRPLLIEAGLSSYGIQEHATHFRSVAGHNVLQVGAHMPSELTPAILTAGAGQILDPAHRAAPLRVRRLDATGGEAAVDASGCYAGVKRWVRTARWDATTITIRDEVALLAPDTVLFRWHLGEPADATVSEPRPGRIEVGGIRVDYNVSSTSSLGITVQAMPDHTLQTGRVDRHATVVMTSAEPVSELVLETRVSLADH